MTQIMKIKMTPTQWRKYRESIYKKKRGVGRQRCGNYKYVAGVQISPAWIPLKFEDVGNKFRYVSVLLISDDGRNDKEKDSDSDF